MELKIISKGYYFNISQNEITELNIITLNNPKNQLLKLLNFAINIVKSIGTKNMGDKIKISITKKNGYYNILVLPVKSHYSSFAIKLNTEKELLTLTEQLCKNNCSKLCISSVYVLNNNYYLLITPLTKNEKPQMICKEFCLNIISKAKEVLNIQHNGKEICSVNAIDKLGESI